MNSTTIKKPPNRGPNLVLYIAVAIILIIVIFAMFSNTSIRTKGTVLAVTLLLTLVLVGLLAVMWHHQVNEIALVLTAIIGVLLIGFYTYGSVFSF